MDEIKRKISVEFDASGDAELSDDLRNEIESSGELKEYADDLIRVEGFLHTLRDAEPKEPEWGSLHDEISQSLDGEGGVDENLLRPPMPDGSEDDSMPESTPEPKAEPKKAEPKKPEKPAEEGPRIRMTAAKPSAKGESSGLINLGALVEQHKKSMVRGKGGLDMPPSIITTAGAEPKSKALPIAIVAGIVVVIGIGAVFAFSRMRAADKEGEAGAIDMAALREQLKEELKAEYKQQILEELKATGMTHAEAVAEAERQAEEKAAAEAEKKAEAVVSEGTAEEALLAMQDSSKKKSKKKKKTGGAADNEASPAPSGPSKPSYTAPKKEPASKSPPKSAGDDLAALLEGATGGKKKGSDDLGDTLKKGKQPAPEKTSAPAPAPTAGLPKTLEKDDIRKTMNKIKPRILKCGEGKLGTLMLALVVSNDGTVKSAKVTGKFATDPAGQCAENVAKTVKFPPFQNPTASVTYPFVFAPTPGQ